MANVSEWCVLILLRAQPRVKSFFDYCLLSLPLSRKQFLRRLNCRGRTSPARLPTQGIMCALLHLWRSREYGIDGCRCFMPVIHAYPQIKPEKVKQHNFYSKLQYIILFHCPTNLWRTTVWPSAVQLALQHVINLCAIKVLRVSREP